ncbi:MAG: VWA domain-containing protein [Chitinophagaceae bacterium]
MQKSSKIMLLFLVALSTSLYLIISSQEAKSQSNNLKSNEKIQYMSNQKNRLQNGPLSLSTALENDYLTSTHRDGYLYVEVQADAIPLESTSRKPLNLSIVIDRSGSMAGEKIKNAKQAAKDVIDQLSEDDFVSIVMYDSEVDIVQRACKVVNKEKIKSLINTIYDRGGTNLMGGAMLGYQEVEKNYHPNRINRVLLLSDGLANEGITDPKKIDQIVRNKYEDDGIGISTFGVGRDYNETLMTAMAETGNGNYYFIDKAQDIASILRREIHGMSNVVAQHCVLQVELPKSVSIEKIVGCKYVIEKNIVNITLRDIFSDETKGVLIKYNSSDNYKNSLTFSTRLLYSFTSSQEQLTLQTNNTCTYTNDENLYNDYYNEWVATQVALFYSNEQLEIAMEEVDKGNYEKARKLVDENKKYIQSKSTLVSKSKELQKAESANEDYVENIAVIESKPASEVKYIQKSSKSMNYQIRNKKK